MKYPSLQPDTVLAVRHPFAFISHNAHVFLSASEKYPKTSHPVLQIAVELKQAVHILLTGTYPV